MNIGIVDVTKSYYFWSGVLEVLCLRTRLIYKFDSALACIYLHSYSVVLNGQYRVLVKGPQNVDLQSKAFSLVCMADVRTQCTTKTKHQRTPAGSVRVRQGLRRSLRPVWGGETTRHVPVSQRKQSGQQQENAGRKANQLPYRISETRRNPSGN